MTHVASTTRPLHNKIIKKGRTNTATLATATATSHGNCNASHIAVDFDVNFDGDAGGGNGDGDGNGNGDVDVSSCCSLSLATRVQSCSFYRARARANKGQRRHNKATSHHSLPDPPLPLFPCSLARSCFNNFHAATTKKTTSVEQGEAEAGQGQKRGGYKMSISSNNAIDKRRQLKQQKWQKSSRRSRQGSRSEGVGCRVSSEACGKFVLSYAPASCCMIKIDISGGTGVGGEDVLAPRQLPSNFKLKEAQN